MDYSEQLGRIVEREKSRAEGRDGDELQANRAKALAYYNGDEPGPDLDAEGNVSSRSQVVSRDVADMCGAISAMMRDMLILDGELVIEPEGERDEQLAKAEADICTDVLMKDNQGERVLGEAIQTALLMKNCAIKVLVRTDGEIEVRGVPIENVMFTAGWAGHFQELPFFAERLEYTRSDLIGMGIDKGTVADLAATTDFKVATSRERNATSETPRVGETEDQDVIACHEAYVLADLDGDGVSERYRCLVANDHECLEYEEIDHIPYAVGTGLLRAYRITGESVYDRIGGIQDRNTALLRQWHDNVAIINNGRYIYSPSEDTEEDIMNPIAGGGIRSRNPAQSVIPLSIPDVSTGIVKALGDNRKLRTEALGGALDMGSAEAQIVAKSATAASIEKGSQELISSKIASDLATTVLEPLYRLIHMYLQRYAQRPYLARVAGQAVPVVPRAFRPHRRMLIRAGLPPGVKAQVQQALALHQQTLVQLLATGMAGTLVDERTVYRTTMRLLKANGISDPESLMIDPDSPAAQQAAQARAQEVQMGQAAQAQAAQAQAQLEAAKLAEDARQHDGELGHKYYATNMQVEIREAELAGQAVIDFEKQRMSDAAAEQVRQSQPETE